MEETLASKAGHIVASILKSYIFALIVCLVLAFPIYYAAGTGIFNIYQAFFMDNHHVWRTPILCLTFNTPQALPETFGFFGQFIASYTFYIINVIITFIWFFCWTDKQTLYISSLILALSWFLYSYIPAIHIVMQICKWGGAVIILACMGAAQSGKSFCTTTSYTTPTNTHDTYNVDSPNTYEQKQMERVKGEQEQKLLDQTTIKYVKQASKQCIYVVFMSGACTTLPGTLKNYTSHTVTYEYGGFVYCKDYVTHTQTGLGRAH